MSEASFDLEKFKKEHGRQVGESIEEAMERLHGKTVITELLVGATDYALAKLRDSGEEIDGESFAKGFMSGRDYTKKNCVPLKKEASGV